MTGLQVLYEDLELEEEITKSAYGKTSKGRYLGTPCCIKELYFPVDTGSDPQKYAEREIKALSRLSHPNVIQLLGCVCVKGTHDIYLVTEYLEGGTFFKTII